MKLLSISGADTVEIRVIYKKYMKFSGDKCRQSDVRDLKGVIRVQ
mgnify:CR=1 FL=1|jgi:hypothetical protein